MVTVSVGRPDLGITMVAVLAITNTLVGATTAAPAGIGPGSGAQGPTAEERLGERPARRMLRNAEST